LEAGRRQRQAELSLTVVTDARMRKLNREYRGKDKTTDVLSFGQIDPSGKAISTLFRSTGSSRQPRQLGDIFISLPQVRRQAREIGRPVNQEFALMVVHGTLHALGFDHKTLAQEKRIFTLQHDILSKAGYF
jgi:probable rRNA maturation factor